MAKVTIEFDEDNDPFGNVALLKKLKPGEPFWVVRAQDKLAAGTVRHWANEAEKAGVGDVKVANARRCASVMLQYPTRRLPD